MVSADTLDGCEEEGVPYVLLNSAAVGKSSSSSS